MSSPFRIVDGVEVPLSPAEIQELEASQTAGTKTWPSAEDFLAEFTIPEKAAVSLSADGTIAALRLELSAWHSRVSADDPRVLAGISRLVELGILTTERQQQILGAPQ